MSEPLDNIPEEWRPVEGYEGLYSVSNLGRVRRECGYMSKQTHFLAVGILRDGYPRVQLTANAKTRGHLLHRLIAKAFIPRLPGKNSVNHKNGIRADFRIENLEWCTTAENNWHQQYVLKTGPKSGEDSPNATITEIQALHILELYGSGYRSAEIGKQLGLAGEMVEQIVRGDTWKHLARDPEKLKSRPTRGETQHMAKLNKSQVVEIRRLNAGGMRYSTLARAFRVAPETVRLICIGRHWKHLL